MPTAYAGSTVTTAPTGSDRRVGRVTSLDVLRGVVMVLMAIDHVRVYSGIPAGGPTAGVFFTRWVTHFCAPVFVFLAGTSAFLSGQKSGDIRALSRHLLTRGIILVLLELTVIRFFWSFTLPSPSFVLAGVIWMLGWCMILMSALVFLPFRALAAVGLVVIFLQDAFGALGGALPPSARWISQVLYFGGELNPGGANIQILYSIVPWIGVMAAGYAFGAIAVREPDAQHKLYWRIGLAATALFLVVGGLATFAGGGDGDGPPALFRLLNQRKYPASQLFLLMTLGPSIAFLPFADRARGWLMQVFETFGRVPMFYYLLHIPVIHAIALVVWFLRDGTIHSDWFATAPYVFTDGVRWGLPLMYLVFAIAIAILYFPCRWYAEERARRPRAWMRVI